jgi:hypothetical protein
VSPGRCAPILAGVLLPLAWTSTGGARAEGAYLQLEAGVMPRTEIHAHTDEHFEVDNNPGPTATVAAGWAFAPWRVQLMLGRRYVNTDGILHAAFQTNGSLTLWPVLVEVIRGLDLAPRTGLPIEAFGGLGGGVAYADLHDFGSGNGGDLVPTGSAQLGLGWRLRPHLTLLAGGRGLLTGTFDSPGEAPGEPHTRAHVTAGELFAGLRLGF